MRYSNIHESEERKTSRSLEGKRRKRGKRIEKRKLGERLRTTNRDRTDAGPSSIKHYRDNNYSDKSRKRKSTISRGKYTYHLITSCKHTKIIMQVINKIPLCQEFT